MPDDWKTRITRVRPPSGIQHDETQAALVLIYPPGPLMGRRFELNKDLVIGRGTDCDIQIDRDSVSRRHARIARDGETGWTIEDLGSTNGTYVGNEQIAQRVMHENDLVKIGNTIFKFLYGNSIEQAYYEEVYRMTIIDGLTEAYNKRYFMEYFDRELARCGRYGRPLSLVLFDIDHFKKVNDDHGHLTGDYVLKEMARRVKGEVRKDELFARYGGEEFVVVLPEAGHEAAMRFAERIRQLVSSKPFQFEQDNLSIRISIGVSTTTTSIDPHAFIRIADENLYRAKRAGRDRVVG